MNTLESEIQSLFTNEKLKLFTRLYYLPRANVEDLLPNEDLSLYTIWAKTKHYLNENLPQTAAATITEQSIQVSHSSVPEHVRESEVLLSQTPETSVADNSTSNLLENVLDVSDHISEKPPELLPTKNIKGRYFGPSTSQVTDMNATDGCNPDLLLEEDIGRAEAVLELLKTVSKDISELAMYTTPNKVQASETNDTILKSLSSNSQKPMKENIGSITESTMSKDIAYLAMYTTPNKVQDSESNDTISKPMPLKPQNVMEENIPSPFKRALFWPEPEIKKRRSKERLPSPITGEIWRAYMIKKESEKKQKEEEKNKRIKERQEKQLIKNRKAEERKKVINKKKIAKTVNNKRKRIESYGSSAEENDISYQESDQDSELSEDTQINNPKYRTESIESNENIPLKDISQQLIKKNTYVIIKYEGEYFPGLIKTIDNNTYEISTMVLSRGNTFRWPDTPDQIWYNREAIIEKIEKPKIVNNRGFFKVPEMEKYLPYIC